MDVAFSIRQMAVSATPWTNDSGLSPPFGTAARGHEHRPGLSCGPGVISQVIPSTSAL